MKRQTAQWVRKAEEDWEGARDLAGRRPPLRDLTCFHCQQAAEKYLKALLQNVGAVVPKTHNLRDLLLLLLPHDTTLAPLRHRPKDSTFVLWISSRGSLDKYLERGRTRFMVPVKCLFS